MLSSFSTTAVTSIVVPLLTSIDELSAVTSIGENILTNGINIWNSNLTSLNGLSNVTSFKGSVIVEGSQLTNWCSLQNILNSEQLSTIYLSGGPTAQQIIDGNCE
jgi:hypothetical protein